jgi:cellulose synthase/poly-beta-1,6-N-acetylglucosamine synthase-like glycosyltransferase
MMLDLSILIIILVILLLPYLTIVLLMCTLGRSVKLRKDYTQKPTVTIFLATYNEEKNIQKKLDNLLEQTYPIHEILIYDCSTDKTPAIIQKYQKTNPSIKLIRQPARIGLARTMNQAFIDATGEILIKTDCDSFLTSRDAISELVANFGDKRVGGAIGICIAQKGVEKVRRKFLTSIQILETNIDSIVIGNSACLTAFKISLVEPVDGYSMAEDTEELGLIRRHGYKVVVDPSVIAEEEVPKEFGKRRLQKDRRAQGVIRVLSRNRSLLLNPRFGLYGLVVLPLELFILVFSPFLLIGLGIVLTILLYAIHPIMALTFITILILAFAHKSNIIAAMIDTELSGLMGTMMNLAKKDNSLWPKVSQ